MEVIISVIIAGIFAMGTTIIGVYQYDKIQRNNQRYLAKEIMFKRKDEGFHEIIAKFNAIYGVNRTLLYLNENYKSSDSEGINVDDLIALWVTTSMLSEDYPNQVRLINHAEKLRRACIGEQKISKEDFESMIVDLYFDMPTILMALQNDFDNAFNMTRIYLEDKRIIDEIEELQEWTTNLMSVKSKFPIPVDYENIFNKKVDKLISLMRRELEETINSLEVNLSANTDKTKWKTISSTIYP